MIPLVVINDDDNIVVSIEGHVDTAGRPDSVWDYGFHLARTFRIRNENKSA